MENFSAQWFIALYISLGALLISFGVYLLARSQFIKQYLLEIAEESSPPVLWRKILKYLLLFTIPGIVLSFTPFSWIELLFSIWSLVIIFTAGQLLVIWNQTSQAIKRNSDNLVSKTRFVAANMISIGIILFLLCYFLIERTNAF